MLEYFWLHYIIDDFWEYIDTEKSYAEVVKLETPTTLVIENKISILSKDQIFKEEDKYFKFPYSLRAGKIIMNKNFPEYDLYQLSCLGFHKVISEALKETLVKENLTGFETKLFDRFVVDS